MKLSKRLLAVLLSAMMIQGAVTATAISVSADEEEFESEEIVVEIPDDDPSEDPEVISGEQFFGDWSYIRTDDAAMILGYAGTDEFVQVPAYIDNVPVIIIGKNTFRNNKMMRTVEIPDSVVAIEDNAFRNCSALESIVGGQKVTTIGKHAFDGCKSMSEFALMFDLSYVGIAAFKNCSSLSGAVLYKVKEIKPYTFWGCSNMQYINSIETVKVGEYAFHGCKNLKRVILIAGENIDEVMTIDSMAFAGCTALQSVDFHWADRVNVRPYAFYNCKSIDSVHYAGSEERWEENVKIAVLGNFYLNKAEKHCSDMNVAELDETEMEMQTGETVQFTYHSAPYVGNEESLNIISWESSDPDVATVDENGNVTAVGAGYAQIKLTSSSQGYNSYVSYCVVVVTQAADSVELNKTAVNVGVGQQYALQATVSPSDAPQEVVWSTSNKKLADVDENGVVTGKKAGIVTVTATTPNGKTATCKIHVKKAPESITLDKEELTLNVNSSYTLQKTLSANSATSFKWTSSDPEVARVYSTGKVVAQKSGTTTITVTTHNGLTASCVVTVK